MNEITRTQTTADLVAVMNQAGCPCGPILNVAEAFEDEQAKFLEMQRPVSHPTLGTFNLVRSPINLSAFPRPAAFDRAGPDAGQHNEEVLLELGLTQDEIFALREERII